MPIPESWPPDVRRRARTLLALCKYYRFSRTLSEAAVPFVAAHDAGTLSDMGSLQEFIDCEVQGRSEHERDAALGAVGAAAMLTASDGWQDLVAVEDGALEDQVADPILRRCVGSLVERRRAGVTSISISAETPLS